MSLDSNDILLSKSSDTDRDYPVKMTDYKLYVNVPWTDTKYTLSSFGITATPDEINYINGVTSNLQIQLNNKLGVNSNAVSSTKATNDSSNQKITSTYIKGLSVNGRVITYTKGDNTTGTITTQDTNTTYSVATTSSNGLMSSSDKSKLDGIQDGAQVNSITSVAGKIGDVKLNKSDVGLGNVTNESKATMFTNPSLTGTPTAPTASLGTNTTQIATTEFVQSAVNDKIAASDALKYKGTIGSVNSTVTSLPNKVAKVGWTYKVSTAGTYDGQKCEVGDMIVCLTDGSDSVDATWNIIQSNIDGAVIGPASSVSNRVAIFSNSSGKVIKDSGFTIEKSVPSDAKFTDTVYTHPTNSGNKHIPSGGSSNQILRWSSDGTAVWSNEVDTTYSKATSTTLGLVKIGYSENGRNYPIELDSDGKMFVNVPWIESEYDLGSFGVTATATELNYCDGVTSNIQTQLNNKLGVNSNAVSSTKATNDGLNQSIASTYIKSLSVSGKVITYTKGDNTTGTITTQDTNTTYSQASSTTLGLVKIGYAENGKNYPVELSNGQMFVNVPWTDTNTTYSVVGANGTTGLVKNGSSVTSASGYTACPIIGGIPYYKDTNTTYTLSSFGITATSAELNYCDGVTSNIQTQLNSKAASSHTHDDRYYTETEINTKLNSKANVDQAMYIGTTSVPINRSSAALTLNGVNISGSAGSAGYVTRDRGANSVTTLSNLPITKSSVKATLSSATTISVTSGMNIGESITVICTPNADFTQPIPNSGSYISMDGDSLSVKSGKVFEINIYCYDTNKYSISTKVQK